MVILHEASKGGERERTRAGAGAHAALGTAGPERLPLPMTWGKITTMWSAYFNALLVLWFLLAILWGVSVKHSDASLIDRVWGLNFIVLSIVYLVASMQCTSAYALLLGLITIWGIRLSWYLHIRNRGTGEDPRYGAMREQHGERFWWYSLFSVYLLQGFLAWVISIPLLLAAFSPTGDIGFFPILGTILWSVGFYFEAVGDYQLRVFRQDPDNRGKVLDSGLWGLTRHPNYFGDALQWWGFSCFALTAPYGVLGLFGPALMTFFLLKVSGVALLEKSQRARKPEYEAYVASVPAFFPRLWPRKRSE